jgi:hypothetical protein
MIQKLINFIKNKIEKNKKNKEFKKRIEELKKRDPFTYKH